MLWTSLQPGIFCEGATGRPSYDIDAELLEESDENENQLNFIEIRNPLSENDFADLQATLPNPTAVVNDFGFDMFKICRDFLCSRC